MRVPGLSVPAVFLALLLLSCFTDRAAAVDFIRGDFNGDGVVDIGDGAAMLTYAFFGGTGPGNSCEPTGVLDGGDVTDNEFFTIADPMRLMDFLFVDPDDPIPAPFPACGPDPTAGTDGFDVVDPDFRVSLDDPSPVAPAGGGAGFVEFPLYLTAPEEVVGLELYFAFDPAIVANPTFEGAGGAVVLQQLLSNVAVLRLADAAQPISVGPGTAEIGLLRFELVGPDVPPPTLEFVPDFFSTYQRRATLVTGDFRDHHPAFEDASNPFFRRGDMNGDGNIDTADLIQFLSLLYDDVPAPTSGCGPFTGDAFDVNDNEVLTPADYLLLNSLLFCGSGPPIAEPLLECGQDPTSTTGGFEVVDPAYRLNVTDIVLIGAGPVEREVILTLQVMTPTPLIGFQLLLEFNDPDLTLEDPFFVPDVPLNDVFAIPRQEGDLVFLPAAKICGTWLPGQPGVWQDLGTLHLHLADNEIEGPIDFLSSVQFGLVEHHNTIIDDQFQDHRPVTEAGLQTFQRGNFNDDMFVNLADPISMLAFLFQDGDPPSCLDAADADNDGILGLADVITELAHLFQMAGPLPEPFDECGADTDVDELECGEVTFCP